jgi:hypothetical protein
VIALLQSHGLYCVFMRKSVMALGFANCSPACQDGCCAAAGTKQRHLACSFDAVARYDRIAGAC